MDRTKFLSSRPNFNRIALQIPGIGTVHVREVSAAEAREHAKREAESIDNLENAARLAIAVLVDDEGSQLLTDADAEFVKGMPLSVLKSIGDAAAEATSGATKKNESGTQQTPKTSSPSASA